MKSVLLALILCMVACTAGDADAQQSAGRRVVVLCFDAMDPRLVEAWMEDGYLPNMEALATQGTFARLETTHPCVSDVSWNSFATGFDPGATGIGDRWTREPGGYEAVAAQMSCTSRAVMEGSLVWVLSLALALSLGFLLWAIVHQIRGGALLPNLAIAAVAAAVMFLLFLQMGRAMYGVPLPHWSSRRAGKPFWNIAAESGRRCVVLGSPISFPVKPFGGGDLLAGRGVPDICDTAGSFYLFSSDNSADSRGRGGYRMALKQQGGKEWTSFFFGPEDPYRARQRRTLPVSFVAQGKTVSMACGGNEVALEVGRWCDWQDIRFQLNAVLSVRTVFRAKLLSLEPLRVLVTPLQYDPRHPGRNVPISNPPEYAARLARKTGLFSTQAWANADAAYEEGLFDLRTLAEIAEFNFDAMRDLLTRELQDRNAPLTVAFFSHLQALQQAVWSNVEPAATGAADVSEAGSLLQKLYQKADELVGLIRSDVLDERTVLLVVSNHGCVRVEKQVSLNAWLLREGYLALKSEADDPGDASSWSRRVDWANTRAYSLGHGQIYLNVAGREPLGIVHPGREYEELLEEIRKSLQRMEGADGERSPVETVHRVRDLYTRVVFDEHAADLLAELDRGYCWHAKDVAGGVGDEVITPCAEAWTGAAWGVAARHVPGIFLSNYLFEIVDPALYDIAPTVLDLLAVEPVTPFHGMVMPWRQKGPKTD